MEKIFFGSVKEIQNDYWTMYSIWIRKEDLNKLEFNEKWFANLSMKKSKKGTWYMEVYQPKEKPETFDDSKDEDLPR